MKYLTKTVETFRVATDAEAAQVIEEAKKDNRFSLAKYESVYKEKKQKGEVIDSWYRVTLHKVFNIEAEPDSYVKIDYDVEPGFFPSPVSDDEQEDEE
jgi:hypothetical protein